jgi:hypothetical protein
MGATMATDEESGRKLSRLARGSAPTKSHPKAPGRHVFSKEHQPPKSKVGRPKGSRNKLTKTIAELLLLAADEVGDSITPGEDGKGGVLGYFKVSAVTERRAFLAMIGRGLPVHINANVTHKPVMTLDEAVAEMKARGLPPQLIEYLRQVDDELGEDDEPDPYDDPINLEAEPSSKTED